ncbi:outer membrane beta-barrel protein [Massilia sp. 2TAF26]|uniref:outer membrane beta-barrel protein n=1 Tax=Massilia sp. 2TAF26 TaxID=3233012 RepID=UPI003F98DDAD
MKAFGFALAAAALAGGSAQAQLADPASQARLQSMPAPEAKAFARIPAPFERAYVVNEGEHPFTGLFDGWRSDPRLAAGINLNRYLALEMGYRERKDRGFHAIDPRDPLDTTGALGTKGFHSYFSVKATAPITDKLSAYGNLGIAYSERRGADALGKNEPNTDIGPYARLGAQYKLNDKASVTVESQNFGNTSQKWGNDTNANGVNAKLKLGF